MSWQKLQWPVCGLIAIAICGGLSFTAKVAHERVERERAIELAKPAPPAPAMCTQVTLTEVKNLDGSVKSTERAESRVPCVQPAAIPYKPFEFPLWAKILGWSLVVLYTGLCIWTRSYGAIPILP